MLTFVKVKNRRNNRHSLDIVRDMLIVASVSVRKTRIMYQANLSYVQVKRYLRDLLSEGLLKRDGNSCYLITEKGLGFLRLYNEYAKQCKQLEEQVNQSIRARSLLERMCYGHECYSE